MGGTTNGQITKIESCVAELNIAIYIVKNSCYVRQFRRIFRFFMPTKRKNDCEFSLSVDYADSLLPPFLVPAASFASHFHHPKYKYTCGANHSFILSRDENSDNNRNASNPKKKKLSAFFGNVIILAEKKSNVWRIRRNSNRYCYEKTTPNMYSYYKQDIREAHVPNQAHIIQGRAPYPRQTWLDTCLWKFPPYLRTVAPFSPIWTEK